MYFRASLLVAITLTAIPFASAVDIDPGLNQALHQVLYRLEPSGTGAYRAINGAQRLTLDFTEHGARLQHPEGSVALHLLGFGYGDHLRSPREVTPVASHDRVEYRRPDLIEWYKNDASGLEQGFTLSKRPGIPGEAEPLVIAMGVDSELSPELTPQRDAVLIGQVMRYGGLQSLDARGRSLPSRLEVGEHEIRIVVDDRDAEYPRVVDPTWVQQQELTDPAGAIVDGFGAPVSVDGDTALIGAPGSSEPSAAPNNSKGHVYVFVRGGSPPVWTFQQDLTAPDGAAFNHFGTSVVVSGNTAVIGAPGWNSNQGAAYVFVRSGGVPSGSWTLQQEVTAPDGMSQDFFGTSVALNRMTLVVGAPGDASAILRTNFDSVYVFVSGATTPPWSLQQKFTVATGFGHAVAVSGDTMVAGVGFCRRAGTAQLSCDGAAYVFVRGVTTPPWTQQQQLNTGFTNSIGLSGDTVLVGSSALPYSGPGSVLVPGKAYVYVRGATTPPWTLQQQLISSNSSAGDDFGVSVALSGNTAVVGANNAAYVFTRSSNSWSQQQKLMPSDPTQAGGFGSSVAISGSTVLAGAPGQEVAYAFVTSIPQSVSVTPNTGSGLGPQTFTATYTDASGAASDLQVVYLDVANSPEAASSCFAAYVQGTNSLYLFNNTNTAILGPITPGSNASVSNSQCTLSGVGGLVTNAGTTLTVPFAITFAQSFNGARNIFGLAQSYSGAMSAWQLLGNWMVGAQAPPNAASVTPNSGSGLTQTFTVTYTDSAGATDIQVVYFQVGLAGGGAYSCFAAYIQGSNSLYLFDDPNTSILGPITPGSNSTVSNSRCTLSGSGGVVTAVGNNLIVPFSLTFAPAYNGQKNLLGYAQNYSGGTTGFQMLGTWTAAAGGTLTAVSVSPVNGSGLGPQTFNAVYMDTSGADDIQATYLDFGPTIFATNSCIVVYVTGNHNLYLFKDDNNGALGPIVAGTNATLSNSQCTLSGIGGLATPSGNNLTVPFNLTFTGAFAAQQMVFGLAQSFGGTQSSWANLGNWTP